jgi:Squalene-hopene cyclase C-terminal domain
LSEVARIPSRVLTNLEDSLNSISKYAAVVVASGVAVASLAGPAAAKPVPAAKTPAAKTPAAAAAGYLARQLTGKGHDHYTEVFSGKTYSNDGETADGVLSMDAAGVAQSAAARATKWLESDIANYAIASPTDYPGSTGKLLLVAEAQHVNPRSFGGLDLIAALHHSEGAGGASAGEFQQNPGFSGASYVVSQALPVLALASLPHSHADSAAVTFLFKQQCTDGGYQTEIRAHAASTKCGTEDVDDTAYAVQALIAAGGRPGAVAKGLAFIAKAQHSNGSFGKPANANSTALAIQALVAGHKSVTAAEKWLTGQQVGCGGVGADRGAVRYESKFDASALLATSQAGAALAGKTLASIDKTGASAATPALACPAK